MGGEYGQEGRAAVKPTGPKKCIKDTQFDYLPLCGGARNWGGRVSLPIGAWLKNDYADRV